MSDIYDLGLIVKHMGNFDMKTFEKRLIFQKTIYLLQSFGIDMGYRYTWYYHGTYCVDLTKDGFDLTHVIQRIPDISPKFQYSADQARYDSFVKFMSDKKENPDLLEIASSISFLHKAGMDKENVLHLTESKKARFKKADCERIWTELEICGVIQS